MAAGSTAVPAQDVLRWYTRALRIPRLLGKAPGGGSWPGGPYTLTQGVGGGLTFVVAQKTMDVWGRFGVLGNLVLLCAATAAVLFGLRFVRSGGRDPVTAAFAIVSLMSRPTNGRYAGVTIRFAKPHQVHHRVNVLLPAAPATAVAQPGVSSAQPLTMSPVIALTRWPVGMAAPMPAASTVDPLLSTAPPTQTSRQTTGTSDRAAPTPRPTPPVTSPRPAAPTSVSRLLAQIVKEQEVA